jgi:hypothetical protein
LGIWDFIAPKFSIETGLVLREGRGRNKLCGNLKVEFS